MSKEWIVTKPIVGSASCIVQAETEEEARRVAAESGDWEVEEWETTEKCRGNVCNLMGIYGKDEVVPND